MEAALCLEPFKGENKNILDKIELLITQLLVECKNCSIGDFLITMCPKCGKG